MQSLYILGEYMQVGQKITSSTMKVHNVRAANLPRRNFIKRLAKIGVSSSSTDILAAATTSQAITEQSKNVGDMVKLPLHDQHIAHQTHGNINSVSNHYSEHAIIEESMHPKACVGHNAIMQHKGLAAI